MDDGTGGGDGADHREGTDRLGADLDSVRDRTDLAWTRSGLAVAITVAVILRHLWPLSRDRAVLALAVVATIAVGWVVVAHLARLRLGAVAEEGMSVSTVRTLTYGTLTLAAVGVLITFV